MDRRGMIKQSSYAIAGMVSLPSLPFLLQSCLDQNRAIYEPTFLSIDEYQTIKSMAEAILPQTELPGANEAAVAPYVDLLFGEYFEDKVIIKIKSQLNNLMTRCQQTFGSSFNNLNEDNKSEFLNELDLEEDSFFRYMKNIMLWAFFTSEQGMKSMNYNPVPGKYNGCYTLLENPTNLAGNSVWWQMRSRYGEHHKQ